MKKEKPKFTLVTRDVQFICFFGTSADAACGYAGLNLEWPQKRSKSFSRWLNRTKILLKSLSHHRNRPLLKNSNHVLSGQQRFSTQMFFWTSADVASSLGQKLDQIDLESTFVESYAQLVSDKSSYLFSVILAIGIMVVQIEL